MCSLIDDGKSSTASLSVSPWQRWIVLAPAGRKGYCL